MTGKLQIGIRHILPVIPFIYLFTVIYLRRGRWIWALLPLIAFSALEPPAFIPTISPSSTRSPAARPTDQSI